MAPDLKPDDPIAQLVRKWSKADAAYKNVGRYSAKGHKEEQAKAFTALPEMSSYEELEMQVDKIIARYTF